MPRNPALDVEGGFTIEGDDASGLRFRNRYGVIWSSAPPRPPPGSTDALLAGNGERGLRIGPATNRNGAGSELDLDLTVAAIAHAFG